MGVWGWIIARWFLKELERELFIVRRHGGQLLSFESAVETESEE